MFTGIIRYIGEIKDFKAADKGAYLTVANQKVFKELREGDSVAINGACLTVLSKDEQGVRFEMGPTTLEKTTLASFKKGDQVNLELPLRFNARLGGHFVQGHIDGVGEVKDVTQKGNTMTLTLELPANLAKQTIKQGSVAIDGVSLTVADKQENIIKIMLMEYTVEHTTLKNIQPGNKVNIEIDMLVKYLAALTDKQLKI